MGASRASGREPWRGPHAFAFKWDGRDCRQAQAELLLTSAAAAAASGAPQTIMLALTAVVVSCALVALAERPKRAGRMA
jgi:hypothetical protein